MSSGSLVLHPTPAAAPPPATTPLVAALREIAFLGAPIGPREDLRFLAGEQFLQLVTFLGCSPYVRLEPQTERDEDFCHVCILGPWETPRLVMGADTASPRCPRCRGRIREWRSALGLWQTMQGSDWGCPSCGAQCSPYQWAWRQQAGFARILVQVLGIFPGEAIPVDRLFAVLRGVSGTDWGYFYTRGGVDQAATRSPAGNRTSTLTGR